VTLPAIPSHWSWKTVNVLGSLDRPAVKAGPFGSALKKCFYVNSGFRVYGQEQVIAGNLSIGDYYIDQEKFQSLKSCEVKAGDILISLVGTFGKVLVVPQEFEPGIINPRLVRLSLNPLLVNPYFFQYFFQSPFVKNQLQLKSHGSTLEILNAKNIAELLLPLPPLEEQNRIVTILDKADEIRRQRKQAIALTEELLRSTFLEMFGDPVTNPKGWEVKPINKIIKAIEAGWSVKAEDRQRRSDEWGVLKVSAVTSGYFKPEEHKAIGNPLFSKPPIIPSKGDLLFSRANTRELVAATCLVQNNYENLFLPDKLWRLKPESKIANVEYLKFLLSDSRYRTLIASKAHGTSGSMLNISQAKLLETCAPIPDLSLQERFAQIVWKVFDLQKKYQLAFNQTNTLFNCLMERAFKGQL